MRRTSVDDREAACLKKEGHSGGWGRGRNQEEGKALREGYSVGNQTLGKRHELPGKGGGTRLERKGRQSVKDDRNIEEWKKLSAGTSWPSHPLSGLAETKEVIPKFNPKIPSLAA